MTSPSRLTIFLPSLFGGGAERIMVMLANEFARRGIKVDLVVARARGDYGRYVNDLSPAVRLVDLNARRLIAALPALIRYIRTENPSVMLSAINMANVVAVIARGLARSRMRLVISERNTIERSASVGDLRDRILPILMRRLYPHADAIVAISEGVASDVQKYTGVAPQKLHIIHNPIDFDTVVQRSLDEDTHIEGIGRPLIVAAGRLEKQKDFATLLEAFAQMRQSKDATLVIMGEGRMREELLNLCTRLGIREHVLMPGFVDNPFAMMRQADLFVMSSAWEGFGNVLVEAMACGKQVVSTDCPSGPAEILENGKWGRLVPVGNAKALAAEMIAALSDTRPPDVVTRAQQFSLTDTADKYLSILV